MNLEEQILFFYRMKTLDDIATLLDMSPKALKRVLYLLKPKYYLFKIPKKSGGERLISAPEFSLKIIQRKLSKIFLAVYKPKPSVHGFVEGKSIVTNARVHKKQSYIFNLDLENFFPSIHFGRIRGLFMAEPYNLPYTVAQILTQLCCTYHGLPQGAPTSPILANMVCRKMDGELQKLAQKHRCYYTRYADDITFSTSNPVFPQSIAEVEALNVNVGSSLRQIIEANGFSINNKKVRLQRNTEHQEVTGLTVNRFPNVQRKFIHQIRAMIYDLKTNGDAAALEKHLTKWETSKHRTIPISFRAIVRGKIEFLGMVRGKNDEIYLKFLTELGIETENKPLKIFLNYASEDVDEVQKVCDILARDYDVWMDTREIKGGEEWWPKITDAIDTSTIFIACLSINSVRKDGIVQQEIDYALNKLNLAKNFFVLPVLIHNVESNVRKDLRDFSYIKYYSANGITLLMDAIAECLRKLG